MDDPEQELQFMESYQNKMLQIYMLMSNVEEAEKEDEKEEDSPGLQGQREVHGRSEEDQSEESKEGGEASRAGE